MKNNIKQRERKETQPIALNAPQQTDGLAHLYSEQCLKHQKDAPAAVGDQRIDPAINDLSLHRIQIMDMLELGKLQSILEHGTTVGRWQTPLKWAGGLQPSMQDICLRQRIVDHLEKRHKIIVQDADNALSCIEQEAKGNNFYLAATGAPSRIHAILDGAVAVATRYLLLCRIGPARLGNCKGRPLDTTTIASIGYQYLVPLLAVGVAKWIDNDQACLLQVSSNTSKITGYLSLVRPEDLDRFGNSTRKQMEHELKRARMLAELDLWTDVPLWDTPLERVTAVRAGVKRREKLPKPVDKHLPLPDTYVAEMGSKSLWIIRELGPNLLTILEQIVQIWESTGDLTISANGVEQRRNAEVVNYLQAYIWRDSQGRQFPRPPFEIRLYGTDTTDLGHGSSQEGEAEAGAASSDKESAVEATRAGETNVEPMELLEWPPRHFAHIIGLMGTLQCAHLFVAAMSAAPRKMELLSFERDCVVRARDGTSFARGRTFKLVERHQGVLRDWVLPEVAVDAIEQQTKLARWMELIGPQVPERTPDNCPVPLPECGTHLWVQNGHGRANRTKSLTNVNHALMSYASALGMSTRPGGQKIRSHRFRKTVARLAALALTDAPMILMQVFGHKSVEMTLYYILTDKDLQVEVEQVRRELKIMRGVTVVDGLAAVAMAEAVQETKEVIAKAKGESGVRSGQSGPEGLPYAGYGGPAAPKLFDAVKAQVIAVHRTGREWGASDSYETAYFLTEAGVSFTMPREGVFCTKSFTQPAACTGKRGKTDPGNCQSDCGHRLELGARRSQLESSLIKLVALYEEALGEGHELLRNGLGKKIQDALKPFDDIRERWMQHATVRQLVEAAGEVAT